MENINKSDIKILLVEDDIVTQIINENLLAKAGCTNVAIAIDGCEALDMSKKENYSLILMDVWLPDTNSMEVTKQIRSDESNKSLKTPIIALTTDTSAQTKKQCLKVGMNAVAYKPISRNVLDDLIKQYCS